MPTITITKLGNLCKLDRDGYSDVGYFNAQAMSKSFLLGDLTSSITVKSRLVSYWNDEVPLSDLVIVATTTHQNMTTESDFNSAMTDLTTLVTS